MTEWRRKTGMQPLQVAGVAFLIVLWEGTAHLLRGRVKHADVILPTIESVVGVALPGFATFGGGLTGEYGGSSPLAQALLVLAEHSMATVARVLIGTAMGLVLGVVVGLGMGWSEKLRRTLDPPLQLLRAVPALALIPLFMVWFGGRAMGPLVYVAFVSFTLIVVNTVEAVRSVPPIIRQYAMSLGATEWQVFRTVVLPAVIPRLIGAVRVTLGSSWAIVLAAEYLSVETGLGRLMILSGMFLFTGRMIVIVLLFMLYSGVLNYAFLRAARHMTRWAPQAQMR
jgi:ABC-type nitrate/sulfonate/bicarbonate transport system permease component